MKLIYRGNAYDYNQTASAGVQAPFKAANGYRSPYVLTYRGTTYMVDPSVQAAQAAIPTSYNLTYRGVTYQVNRNTEGVTTTTVQTAPQVQADRVPPTLSRNYITKVHTAKVHKANLLQNVQRRLKVARERGDQELVRMLEAELNQLAA
ncbi:DUF4278 domain-containing protein [Oscillatoria sp. FACHB-1407]|uniref:arginine synthesis PII-interacting regulator PirA n=1 Tax=Oscillatoria sp. FACHB-1407 TaxID=2692847 RepID=UPI001684B7A8|nr:DUF4278 domain-containing protein [Oscillatoria sp. FACHB-1407]MBD2464846.1 DUF4278 domain-containing protein [Oscillatoria sp. FACHB-1407]